VEVAQILQAGSLSQDRFGDRMVRRVVILWRLHFTSRAFRDFERTVLGAYRWLSDNYMPGDCIFLFGVS
jgi:uncharacterized protein (DUF2235 family)